MCTLNVSNVIYHKFSHGAAFYTFNGKNVNVMLKLTFRLVTATCSKSGSLPATDQKSFPNIFKEHA